MDGIPIVLFIAFTARIADGASCNTKFSDAYFMRFFGLKASSKTTKNKASDAFTVGWCATTKASPNLEVDFKNPYGISGIHISGPTNRDGDPYPTSVLVKYVPNGGDVNNFVHFPLQEGKLVINMTTFGTVQSNFGQGIAVRKLQFTIQSFHGDACLKIDLIGCTIHDLCTYGCQNNGLCVMQDTCQCAQGYLGNNCEKHACEPVDLGLADGTIGADHIQVSSEDPVYNKAQLGNSGSKKGWCPSLTDHFPWVQITLDQPRTLSVFSFMWSQLGGQNIMTEFELQYIAPIDSSKQFRTFATNIPSMNSTHIFTVTTEPVVVTDTIRIIATNWDNRACFKVEIKGCDPTVLCSSGWCQNGGTCMGENVCLCPSGFVGSRCEIPTNQIAVTNMTFVKIENHMIITTAATLQFTINGNVKLEVVGNKPVVTINGTDSCIKLNQTTGVPSCITDVNLCNNGFTFTIDVNFGHLLDNTYIVSSGGHLPGHSGITLYYTNKHLHYIVSTNKKVWTLVVPYKPVLHIWQHFEITWNKHLGVKLLIDGHSLGSNSRPSVQPTSTKTFDLYIGCSLTSATVNTNMQITAIHAWTIDRTELVNAGVKDPPATANTHLPTTPTTVAETTPPITTATTTTLQATTPPSFLEYNLTFVTVVDNLLITPTFNFTLHNKPVLELQNNSQTAIVLDCSKQQYVELPDTGIPCLENLDDCEKGFTFKLEVMFTKLEPVKKAYILSSGGDATGTNGMAIYIHNSQMIFGVKKGIMHWIGFCNITNIVKTDIWYQLEVSWSAQKGELVLIDGYQVIKSNQWTPSPANAATNPVLVGKMEASNGTTCMKVKDMFIWTTEREVLVDHDIVKVPATTPQSTVRPTTSSTVASVTRTSTSLTSLTSSTYFQRYTTMPSASTSALQATTPPSFLEYNLTFVTVVDNLLITPTFNFTLHNKPVLELQNNSQTAIVLDCSKQQYVELPDTGIPCLENLDDCEKGFTFKLEVMFTKLEPVKKAYILSSGGDATGTNGMAIYIHNSQMIFGVKKGIMHWIGFCNITNIVKTDIWYQLEVSWSAQKGELVLIDGYQVIKSNQWTPSLANAATNPVLVGKMEASNGTTCMKVKDMFIWTTEREVLVDHDIVKVPATTQQSTVRPTTSSTVASVTRTSTSLTSLTSSTYFQRYTTMPSASTSVQYLKFEDAIIAKCTSYGWNISMDLSTLWFLYPGITGGDIYLSSAKCNGTLRGDKLWFQQSFETCATREEVVDGKKVFRNVLFYASFDNLDPTIVRQHFWTYNIACYVSNGEATSSHLRHEVESHSTNITAHRDISMTFFKDRNFLHQVSGNPLTVTVGDNVYVKVSTSIPDWSTKMRLHTCYTRSSDNTVAEHILIRDGCEVDSSTHIISQSTHDTKFVFRDFEYLTFNEGLDIFCNATFCDTSDYSSACTQACRQSPPIVG